MLLELVQSRLAFRVLVVYQYSAQQAYVCQESSQLGVLATLAGHVLDIVAGQDRRQVCGCECCGGQARCLNAGLQGSGGDLGATSDADVGLSVAWHQSCGLGMQTLELGADRN